MKEEKTVKRKHKDMYNDIKIMQSSLRNSAVAVSIIFNDNGGKLWKDSLKQEKY